MIYTVLASSAQVCTTGADGFIAQITQYLVDLMGKVGGVGVMLAIAAESIFPPIPSEIILPLAGFTASQGHMSLIAAIVWASVGSLIGALVLYAIARIIGLDRLRAIAQRIPGVSDDDIVKANTWFSKYSTWSVLIGRCIPVVRSLISIPAGLNRMNVVMFSLWSFLGSLIWNIVLCSAGFLLGERWCSILGYLDAFQYVVYALIAVLLVLLVARWIHNLRVKRS